MFHDRQAEQIGEGFPPELVAVFESYRQSLPDSEGSPDFMPKLWERIESERNMRFGFNRLTTRLTRALVPVSACLCAMTFAVALLTPLTQTLTNQHSTWVEVLADDNSEDEPTAL